MLDREVLALMKGQGKKLFLVVTLMLGAFIGTIGLSVCIVLAVYEAWVGQGRTFTDYRGPFWGGITALLVTLICGLIAARLAVDLGGQVRTKMRAALFDKALRLGPVFNDYLKPSAAVQLTLEGTEDLDGYFSTFVPAFFFGMIAPFMLFGGLLVVGLVIPIANPVAWIVALVLLALVPVIPLTIGFIGRFAKKDFYKYWNIYLNLGNSFLDALRGLYELKDFGTEERKGLKLAAAGGEFKRVTLKVLKMELLSLSIMDLVAYGGSGAGIAIALGYGFAADNPATWCVVLFVCLMALQFFLPMRRLGALFMVGQKGLVAGRKINQVLQVAEPVWGSEKPAFAGLTLRNVSFHYSVATKVRAVAGVSLTLPATGFFALAGVSGAGKSTIAKLLTGSIRPRQGTYEWSGCPIAAMSRDWFYQNVGLVSGKMHLFDTTIRDNFKFYDSQIGDETIAQALDKVDLSYLYKRRDGLDYRVLEDGQALSGGEKQRLALACALVVSRKFWVFDEVSSSVDAHSARIIVERIKALAQESLCLLITHKLTEVEEADFIYTLKAGQIVDEGRISTLLSMPEGEFARLYRGQKILEGATL